MGRPIFSILEDTATNFGVPLAKKVLADSETGSFNEAPVLAFSDNGGLLRHGPIKVAGQAPGNAIPGMIALDSSGDLAYITLNAAGQVPVAVEAPGTCKTDSGTATAVVDTPTIVATVALTASKGHTRVMASGSNFHSTIWTLEWVDDDGGGGEAINEVARFLTGPGDFSHQITLDCIEFTTGGAGVQTLRLRGEQKFGAGASDLHGVISVLEKV